MKPNKLPTISGAALAIAAASLLVGCDSAPMKDSGSAKMAAGGSADLAHCYGVNACGGHNDCKSAHNACKGMAACKGMGFVAMPSKSCGDVGGTVKDEWRGTIAKADLSQCYGVNKCAGHNDCKTANNACGGHASCKGKGFVLMGSKACGDVGGKTS